MLDHVRRRGDDLGDHVARPQDDHVLACPDVLAHDVLLVVQGRELDRHAAGRHRLEDRIGAQVAELAHVPHHLVQPRDRGRGRELPSHRPARVATDRAEPALERQVGHLDHNAVDLEVELPAALLPAQALRDHLSSLSSRLMSRLTRKPCSRNHSSASQCVSNESRGRPHLVGPHRQRTFGHQRGIELAHRAGGRVARVHEGGQALFGATLVDGREIVQRHIHLAAHLQQRRRVLDVQRDRADRAQVVRHVLPHLPVAAGGTALEHAVAIEQAHRQAVHLRLDHVLEARALRSLRAPGGPSCAPPKPSAPPRSARWQATASAPGAGPSQACPPARRRPAGSASRASAARGYSASSPLSSSNSAS